MLYKLYGAIFEDSILHKNVKYIQKLEASIICKERDTPDYTKKHTRARLKACILVICKEMEHF